MLLKKFSDPIINLIFVYCSNQVIALVSISKPHLISIRYAVTPLLHVFRQLHSILSYTNIAMDLVARAMCEKGRVNAEQ